MNSPCAFDGDLAEALVDHFGGEIMKDLRPAVLFPGEWQPAVDDDLQCLFLQKNGKKYSCILFECESFRKHWKGGCELDMAIEVVLA